MQQMCNIKDFLSFNESDLRGEPTPKSVHMLCLAHVKL